jgi:hypothetical protein
MSSLQPQSWSGVRLPQQRHFSNGRLAPIQELVTNMPPKLSRAAVLHQRSDTDAFSAWTTTEDLS